MDNTDMLTENADLLGVAVTYTPKNGDPVAVSKAGWEEERPNPDERESGEVTVRSAKCTILVTDVASPVRLATVINGSETWTVEMVRPLGTDANELELTIADAVEAAPGYRLR